ncbi:MAG: ATP-binding protein [Pirellulales bacterium]
MIDRTQLRDAVSRGLERAPAVALLGPRQCGKTTIAREIASNRGVAARFFDLEHPADEAALQNPMLAMEGLRGLVVIDEVQRLPELFPVLRVLIDRPGSPAKFLLLGSASPHLVRGVTESLAGRVAFVDMQGFSLGDVGLAVQRVLWLRGGFPRSFLAAGDDASFAWRNDFLRSFMERDFGTLGLGATPASLGRLWRMAAHHHGQYLNASEFGRSLGETHKTVLRHLEMLSAAFMIRLLPPWFANLGKRLVRRPKIFVRDSGLLHALLGIPDESALLGHPKLGGSWEGFAMEQIIACLPYDDCSFWATQSGAEVDLLTTLGGRRVGFEFKVADAPKLTRSMLVAQQDLGLDRLFVVAPVAKSYTLRAGIEVVPLADAISGVERGR